MNKKTSLAAAIALALSGAGHAFDNTTASIYYKLPFGGNAQQTIPSYGLNVSYDIEAGTFGNSKTLRPSLVDFRFQQQQLQDMKLNGVTLLARDKQTNELNVGGVELTTEQALVLGGVVIGGILCATENVICEDDDDTPPPAPDDGLPG